MLLALLFSLAACTAKGRADTEPADTAADTATDTAGDTAADTATDTDTAPDTGPDAPHDRDDDGVPEDMDCDDRDPAVYPGAVEAWNDRDDDCDGVVDADGAWAGTVRVDASAVYEGRPYAFSLGCPLTGTRASGVFAFTVTCTPDAEDADAQRLLGATLTITPDNPTVIGSAWEGTAVFTSSNGWDSNGEGLIAWGSFDAAHVSVEMSGVSLAAIGSGTIARD